MSTPQNTEDRETQVLANNARMLLSADIAPMFPRAVKNQYSDRDWRLICKGRELALAGCKKMLRKGLDNE